MRKRIAWIAALCLAALVAIGLVVLVVLNRGSGSPRPAATSPATTRTPTVTQPAPVAAAVPDVRQFVAPAAPTSFKLTGPAFTIRAHVCAMANVRPYDPPGEQHHTICWVRSGFGDAPASSHATSYLFGHSWAPDPQEVLNKASELATREILRGRTDRIRSVKPDTYGITAPYRTTAVYPVHALDGYRLVLRTATGTLTYQVRHVYGVPKEHLGYIASWEDPRIRNRVVLTTCAELHGVDYDYNVVIEAYLVKSISRAAAPRG